jgi:hypothetical protein
VFGQEVDIIFNVSILNARQYRLKFFQRRAFEIDGVHLNVIFLEVF